MLVQRCTFCVSRCYCFYYYLPLPCSAMRVVHRAAAAFVITVFLFIHFYLAALLRVLRCDCPYYYYTFFPFSSSSAPPSSTSSAPSSLHLLPVFTLLQVAAVADTVPIITVSVLLLFSLLLSFYCSSPFSATLSALAAAAASFCFLRRSYCCLYSP